MKACGEEDHASSERGELVAVAAGQAFEQVFADEASEIVGHLAHNEGELQSWQNAPSSPTTTAQYLYDGQGQRVEQSVTQAGTTTTTVFVGDAEELSTSGGTTTTTPTTTQRASGLGCR